MEIKSRSFPYPVLAPNTDDFVDGSLEISNFSGESLPERYKIRFSFRLSHPCLEKYINSGDAEPAVVIECRENLYRKRHSIHLGMNEIVIGADELRGVVQVTPLISALREIQNYRPKLLNSDYDGLVINMPRHGILAYGDNWEFIAEPCSDRLRRISSIMRVIQVENSDALMNINIGGARIHVEVSEDQFRIYQSIASSRMGSSILASMLVFPVLIDVFHRIKAEGKDGLEDYRWFQVVRARLQEVSMPVESSEFDPIAAAQILLDSPFHRGLSELFTILELDAGK
jgi:hypothetical protein